MKKGLDLRMKKGVHLRIREGKSKDTASNTLYNGIIDFFM